VSPEQQKLADLRKRRSLSQQEVGVRVAKDLHLKWTPSAAQKRISNWEAGTSRPSASERRALAKVLGIAARDLDSAILDSAIQKPRATGAWGPFEALAADDALDSFVAICFTSKPAGPLYPAILSAMQRGIAHGKISFAMFGPFCLESIVSPGDQTDDPETARDYGFLDGSYIKHVWNGVFDYYKAIREGVMKQASNGFVLEDHLKIYKPADGSVPFPPSGSRHCLVIRAVSEVVGAYDKKLYMWIHTAQFNDLEIVDTDRDGSQLELWEAYYTDVVRPWFRDKSLPDRNVGFWRTVDVP